MDLNAVAIFVRIVETGSLTAAARTLQIPKTTVSKRLAQLEKSLGVALITRTTRKLHVTEAGKGYFQHSQAAVRRLELGRAELSSAREHPCGTFRITAPVDVAHALLPGMVDVYTRRYPQVRVELLVTNRIVDLIDEKVDLAIRAGAMRDSSLGGRRFVGLTSNVYASPEYLRRYKSPLHPKDLASADFIAFTGMRRIHLVKGTASVVVGAKPKILADDLTTVRELVAQGSGIGWLPDMLAQADSGRLLPAIAGWRAHVAGQLHFLFANPKHPSVNVQAFVAVATELLPSMLPKAARG